MASRLKNKMAAWVVRRLASSRKATSLVSQSLDRKLSVRERTALAVHMRLCSYCVHFREQLEVMRRVLGIREDDVEGPESSRSISLSPESRERIKKVLRDYLDAGKINPNRISPTESG
jgi:hypothetical protein